MLSAKHDGIPFPYYIAVPLHSAQQKHPAMQSHRHARHYPLGQGGGHRKDNGGDVDQRNALQDAHDAEGR